MVAKTQRLAHTKWLCKYYIVFSPKYRRKVIFAQLRTSIGEILRDLCRYKGVEILEGHLMPDHVHMLVSIPPEDKRIKFYGTTVWGSGDNVATRLGVRAYLQGHSAVDDKTGRSFQPFVEANWLYNNKAFGVAMNDVKDYQAGTRNVGEVKVGVEAHLNKNLHMWGSVGQQMGGKGYSDTQATIGIKFSF